MPNNPKRWYIYIMTNKYNTTLYTGFTNDIERRVEQHKIKSGGVFTRKYNLEKLVYMEYFPSPEQAIAEEKRIKGGSRAKKIALIESINPDWVDLAVEVPDDQGNFTRS